MLKNNNYCYFFHSFQCIQHRALNPDDPSLPDLEPVIARWQIYTAANTFQHLEFNNSWEIIILQYVENLLDSVHLTFFHNVSFHEVCVLQHWKYHAFWHWYGILDHIPTF